MTNSPLHTSFSNPLGAEQRRMFDFLHTRGFAFPFVGPIARGKSSLYEQTVRGPRGEHEGPRFNLNTPRPRNHGPDAVSRARRAPRPVLTARVTARTSTLPARLFHGARRVPHLGQSTRTMSVPVSTAVEVTGNPAEYKSGEMNSYGRRRHSQGCLHHRYHRPGQLLPRRAPSLQGYDTVHKPRGSREDRPALASRAETAAIDPFDIAEWSEHQLCTRSRRTIAPPATRI